MIETSYPVTHAKFTGQHGIGDVSIADVGIDQDGTVLEALIVPPSVTNGIIASKGSRKCKALKEFDEDVWNEVGEGVVTYLFISADEESLTLTQMLYKEAARYNLIQFKFQNVAQLRAVLGPWKSVAASH